MNKALTIRVLCLAGFLMPGVCSANEVPDPMHEEIFEAAAADDVTMLQGLLENHPDLEFRDRHGRTPLLVATRNGAINTARLLMQMGADVNAKDQMGDSPYLYAGAEGPRAILLLTLEYGADLEAVNRYGGTALIPAAHHGHIDIVRDLVGTDINIDHVNNLGWTALLEAIILGDGGPVHVEIVRTLLQAGADRSIPDAQGVLPVDHARNRGYDAMVRLLE